MTTKALAAVVVAAAAWIATTAMGQSATSKPAMPSGTVSIAGGYGTYEELQKACDLTPEQVKKLADIEARQAKVRQAAQDVTAAAQGDISKAQAEKDNDALYKAIAKINAANAPVYDAYLKARDEMATLLTREQKAKWQEFTVLKGVKQAQPGVTFSDAQWDKILEAYEKMAKDSKVQSWEITMKLNAKIDVDILTPEQKAKKMLATRYALMNQAVHFTDEQIAKLVKIDDERTKESAELQAKNTTRLTALQQAWQAAYASGDTDAQATVQKGYAEMYKATTDLNSKYTDKIEAFLTEKQRADWKEVKKNNPYWQWGVSAAGTQPVAPGK